jgi:hypothetical protein
MKTFLYVLITNFVFSETDEKVVKENVYAFLLFSAPGRVALKTLDRVLTRPYVANKFKDGSQCPMIVTPYIAEPT